MDMGDKSVKVSIVRCENYEPQILEPAIKKSFENIGGLSSFIKSGDKVLLKINMLSAKNPQRAITTHPALVEEVAKLILELDAVPMIGDSPGGAVKGVKRYWERTGIQAIADKLGIELVNFETSGTYEFSVNGRILNLAKPIFDADVVINMPKLKTHGLTLMTAAIKNMYGSVPGLRKAVYHKENPVPVDFSALLLDIYMTCKPQLTLMDAVIGMEGRGPSSGKPRKIGLILAGVDGMAIDEIAAQIIGYEPSEIDTISLAKEKGLREFDEIEIIGEKLADVKIADFDLIGHHRKWKILRWGMRVFGKSIAKILDKFFWVRPIVNHEICTRCQFCIRSCPVKAMRLEDNKVLIDYNVCINCLCCHELCPEDAIEIQTSFLARRFR